MKNEHEGAPGPQPHLFSVAEQPTAVPFHATNGDHNSTVSGMKNIPR